MLKKYYCTFIVFLFYVNVGLARTGGGQGYGRSSGGGFSGGGFRGGGGGGGDGGDITWIIYLILEYPLIGIPVAVVALIVFYKSGHMANTMNQHRVISKYSHSAQSNKFQAGLQQLQAMDPQFNEKGFRERVEKTFLNLQEYWSAGDIRKIRPFVADGLYESFSIVYERYRHFKLRNDMQDVSILSCEAIDIDLSEHYHTVTYKIRATAVDSMRDTESGKFVGGSKVAESFTEYWSFIRKPGAQTLNKPGILEGNCPNCASPLEMMDKTTCPACSAVISSGEYDWLLVEISQSDWQPEGTRTIPGVRQMVLQDPGFNRQAIEDRVTTAFWNVRRAEFEASTKKLSKYASAGMMQKLADDFKESPGEYYADPAVGKVELLYVQANDQGLDRAYAKICWSGHSEVRSDKRAVPDYFKSTRINQVYVFERQSGVQTEAQNSLSSAHCPGCGAPASDQTRGNCEYCGTPFNDGSKDWIMTAIMPYIAYQTTVKIPVEEQQTLGMGASMAVPAAAPSVMSGVDKEQLMASIIHSMLDDQVIDEEEQAVLMEFLQHMNMSVEHINQLMNGIHNGSYTVLIPEKPKERKELLIQVIKLCLLDSKISKAEQKVIESMASKFGYGHADVKMMIKKQRGALYKEGRSYLKSHK